VGIRPAVWVAVLLLSLAMWAGLIAGACFVVAFVLNP
jgi:uncharacterized protein YneF (UPF0154 family)